jgi:hypothetical protein
MDWGAIGAVGEIIGGVAVILSILYLAYQIRESRVMAKGRFRRKPVAFAGIHGTILPIQSDEICAELKPVTEHGYNTGQATDNKRCGANVVLRKSVSISAGDPVTQPGGRQQRQREEKVCPAHVAGRDLHCQRK